MHQSNNTTTTTIESAVRERYAKASQAHEVCLCVPSQGYDPKYGVDLHFIDQARADRKKVVELESVEFQARTLGGLSDADEYAVGLAKGARFSPGAGRPTPAEYSSGNLVFRWHTHPPTNAPGIIRFELP